MQYQSIITRSKIRLLLSVAGGLLFRLVLDVILGLVFKNYQVAQAWYLYLIVVLLAYVYLSVLNFLYRTTLKSVKWEQTFKKSVLMLLLGVGLGALLLFPVLLLSAFLPMGNAYIPLTRMGLIMVLLLVFLLILIVADVTRYFFESWKHSLVQLNNYKKENAEYRYKILQNQVNPHFLFNSLNTLGALIKTDGVSAGNFTRQLASLYRYILDNRKKELVRVSDELKAIESYRYLLEIRFQGKLNLEINVQHNQAYLIPLSLQMLVENAVKHNVVSSKRPLNISIIAENGYIKVSNNKQLKIQKEHSTGMGLQNIKNRFRYFTANEVRVEESEENFSVWIPTIKLNENESTDN